MITLKYIFAGLLILAIMMTPWWFSYKNKQGKVDQGIVRCASWLLGWTGIGWIFGLWWAIKK